MLGDSLQLSGVSMSNDDISIQWLIIIFRLDNDSGDLICCGTIVTAWVANRRIEHFETNGQLCILCNPFGRVTPKLYIGIDLSKDVLNN